MRNELSLKLSFIDLNHVCHLFLIGNDKVILKHKPNRNKKLNNVRVTTIENSSQDPDKVIYNFSDYKLTESEKSVCVKALNLLFHPASLNMRILCCA